MSFRVAWHRKALRELAAIWVAATDQKAISRAAHYIERLLMIDPHHEGTPYGRKYRRLFVTPLAAKYSIDDRNQTATIVSVSHEKA